MSLRTKVFYIQPKMRVFRSSQSIQRGHGIGGLFRGLLRVAKPFVKKTLLNVGEKALTMGAQTLNDMRENNTTPMNAIKKQFNRSKKPINTRAKKRKSVSLSKPSKRKVARKLESVINPHLQ